MSRAREPIDAPRPRLILELGTMLYLGPGMDAETHAHHAVQLVLAFDGDVTVEQGGRAHVVRAALVPSDAPHRFAASGRRIALILVDRQAPHGARLDALARQYGGRDLAEELALGAPHAGASADDLMRWAHDSLAPLLRRDPEVRASSDAVRAAIAYVARELGRPRLDAAARAAGVSPSHLTHLFSAEVGIPFRRYVLWARVVRAIEHVRGGASLTEAAIAAGFSDSAHLSRTVRRTFGLPPSYFLHAEIAGTFKPGAR